MVWKPLKNREPDEKRRVQQSFAESVQKKLKSAYWIIQVVPLHLFPPASEFELMHVDEFIDELLHSERMCDIILPRLQVRLLTHGLFKCPYVTEVRVFGSRRDTSSKRLRC